MNPYEFASLKIRFKDEHDVDSIANDIYRHLMIKAVKSWQIEGAILNLYRLVQNRLRMEEDLECDLEECKKRDEGINEVGK